MQMFLKGNPTANALVASSLAIAVLLASFSLFEPLVTHGQSESDVFEITQEITSEISFLAFPGDVTMDDTIQGITGGNAYGTSTFNITTNNPGGYVMTIGFTATTAMQGENLSSDIDNYTPAVGGTPDYNMTVAAGDAEFAYSVHSITDPTDIDSRFKDDGVSACNTGSGTLISKCWYGTSNAITPVQIINRPDATPGTGATSTVIFQVMVGANPSPALETGFYTATATLTATVD